MERNPADQDEELTRAVVRLHAGVLAMVGAVIGGALLFVMTAWLLIKGGPNVGAHLGLLGQYFPGYTVTWTGCFIGMFYGAAVGFAAGWCFGAIYNRVAGLRE
jgi:hypothetical protein